MSSFEFENKQKNMFETLAAEIGADAAESIRRLYTLSGEDMIDWFASLYDSEIGGYYYSISGRDNEKMTYNGREYILLPDAESTCQALGFIRSSGLSEGFSGYATSMPEWFCKKTADYIYSLQDPDGYFYHPQWGKEITIPRRARDFNWCLSMLEAFGREKKYPTIYDRKDEGSKGDTLIPEHLRSEKDFLDYLERGNIAERSYALGNQLSCQAPQIISCGFADLCIDYLNSHQHPDTGHWHFESNYTAVNGVMKITGFYNSAKTPIPNAAATARSAIYAITSDETVNTVVDLWNTWEAVIRIIGNLKKYGGDEGINQAAAIVAELRENAKYMVDKSYDKIAPFKKDDGGFSYKKEGSSFISQGMPVAIKGAAESDVNATVIASRMLLGSIYSCLGASELFVPMFGKEHRERYIEILEKNRK